MPAEKAPPYYQLPSRTELGGFGAREGRRHTPVGFGLNREDAVSPADVYRKRWIDGGKLYTEGTGMAETPLLAAMINGISNAQTRRLVLDVGAGSGDQAFLLASKLPNTNVVAIDTSEGAIRRIHERAPKYADRFASGSQLTVVLRGLQESVNGLRPNSLHGFHANSVFHFVPEAERVDLLGMLVEKLTPGGLVAVSYKAYDREDALVSDPNTHITLDHGKGYLVTPTDGIERLFVDKENVGPVASEFSEAGLEVIGVHSWSVNGYDKKGQDSHFVGFLAKKAA